MRIRLASPLQKNSVVDGKGIRAVIWTQGCPHHCVGCHNPETHDFDAGYLVDVDEIKKEINALDCEVGVTFSGGDPFAQPAVCAEIARYCHDIGMNVWCYTGYTYEQLLKLVQTDEDILHFLEQIDVLVDGPFVLKQKSLEIKFRGSTNQRIIDVVNSLSTGKVVLLKFDNEEHKKENKKVYI